MLGRRDTQAGLFDAESLIGADQIRRLPLYGDLAGSWRRIFKDELFAPLYANGKGRPSIPPSILATATVLQGYENISDQEVVERTKYDLRWKAVFDTDPCSLKPLFAKSTYQLFRLRLVLNGKQGLIFQAALDEARRQGFLPKKLRVALDSSPIRGRGAVKDAFNLLSDGIGKVLRATAAELKRDASEVARDLGLSRHLERGSVKGSRVVDWEDEASVRDFLAEVVADCKKAVEAAQKAGAAGEELDLLKKVVAENVEEGAGGPRIPQKVPPGRTTSVHDEEMQHGRKSTGKLYTGHKIHIGVEVESRFLTAIEIDEPAVAEGEHVGSLIEQSEERTGGKVVEGLGDCAYGTRKALAQAKAAKVPLVTKLPSPPKSRFGPGDFTVSEDGEKATCPAGYASAKVGHPKAGIRHQWTEEQCGACPLKARCLRGESKKRSLVVASDFHERRAREDYARSPEGREKLRLRVIVEHAIGYLKNPGAGQARYVGRAKTLFQWFVCGTVQNLRRLFSLSSVAVLVALLPTFFLVFSAASAATDQDTSSILDTKPVTSAQERAQANQDSLGARRPSSHAAVRRAGSPEVGMATRHAPTFRVTLPARSRRWLLRQSCSPRGPPDPLRSSADPGAQTRPKQRRTCSAPGQRPGATRLRCTARQAEVICSPATLKPLDQLDLAALAAHPHRRRRQSPQDGRIRGGNGESASVRRQEQWCAWRRGSRTPQARAPPVSCERSPQNR